MNGLPFGDGGRKLDGDPVEIGGVRFVEFFIEGSGVVGGGGWHLNGLDVRAVGRSRVLQVNSMALFGQLSIRNQE